MTAGQVVHKSMPHLQSTEWTGQPTARTRDRSFRERRSRLGGLELYQGRDYFECTHKLVDGRYGSPTARHEAGEAGSCTCCRGYPALP